MTQHATVAIIGLGNIGKAVAANLVKSNRSFIAADRNIDKAKEAAEPWGAIAQPANVDMAVKQADILLLAIPFPTIAEFFNQYATELAGKIIIDPSNPIAPDEKGGFKKIVGEKESAGEINAAALPQGAKLVKAFGTLGAASLENAAYQKPDEAVMFYATDDGSANATIEQLIQDAGFAPLRIGGLNQSIRLEVFGDLHEFGALGKTVTIAEAKAKL
jgi:8-hydroxy-5-deazaflavin:NADPH oxidoreductase